MRSSYFLSELKLILLFSKEDGCENQLMCELISCLLYIFACIIFQNHICVNV